MITKANTNEVSEQDSDKPITINDPLSKQITESEKRNIVICGIISLTVVSTLYLNVGAFFPLYVDMKFGNRINTTMVAIILCAFEVSAVLSTPIHAITISKMGRKNAMIIGLIAVILATYMLGFLAYFKKDQWLEFYLLAILARLIQGYGDSLAITTIFSVVSSAYPDNKAKYISMLEAAGGLGLMIGPPIGSIIYG